MVKHPNCESCPLFACAGPVETEFNTPSPDVFFVGESPGRVEVSQGRPMVGPAGQVLRHTLKYLNVSNFAIGNVWRCRPPDNKLPEDVIWPEVCYCREKLRQEIEEASPRLVVLLGDTALRSLTNADVGISQIQGHIFSSSGQVCLPMFHPSYLRRHGTAWRSWEVGVDKMMQYLETGSTNYISFDDRKTYSATTSQQATKYLQRLHELKNTHNVMACDIETSAGYVPWNGSEIISISIAWVPQASVSIDWSAIKGDKYNFTLLKSLLEDPSITWLWYNGQFDTQHLRYAGIDARIDRDAMLEAHLVDEREGIHSLKKDSGLWLDAPDWEWDVKKYVPGKEDDYRQIPRDKLLRYNGLDTVHTLHLSDTLRNYMSKENLVSYCDSILVPAYNMLARARFAGLRVDIYKVQEIQGKIKPVIEELEHNMCVLTNNAFFNPNSYRDKLSALHSRGINVPNTRKETLQDFEGDELVDMIRDFMDASKINGTYLEGIIQDVYDDLRVHPDWKLPAETGRLRCQNPNMLGMPRKAEVSEHKWKRYVKEVFIADPGTFFMHIDRSQSEVRSEVFLANAVSFIEHLKNHPEADIHGEFTSLVYGTKTYTKEQRVLIKMVVFGLIYNREAKSLAMQFTAIERQKARKEGRTKYKEWTIREAQQFINKFFERFPEVLVYKKWCEREALTKGYLVNYFGRIRRFGLIDNQRRHHVCNEAVNFMPSSLSNDINLISCTETMRRFGKYGVEVIVPIHDAGLIRIPNDSRSLVDEIHGLWKEIPRLYLKTDLPFPCDVTIGERWSEL